jgi:hypothetical protein
MKVQGPELFPGVQRLGEEREARRVDGLDAYGPIGQVEAAQVVAVLEEAWDDLPEPERDYGQVVSSETQRRRADDHTAQRGEGSGKDQEQPEGDVYPLQRLSR